MALDINGYNTDFNAFVKFAQNSFVTNDKTAVARFEVGGAPLGGRLIVAANPQFDKVGFEKFAFEGVSMGSDPMDTRPEERSRASLTRQT